MAHFSGVRIHGYRGFRSLAIDGLTRVNLIVGTNNSGKTSVLEAIELVAQGAHPLGPLLRGANRRNEYILGRDDRIQDLDLRHLFYGHTMDEGDRFVVDARKTDGTSSRLEVSMAVSQEVDREPELFLGEGDAAEPAYEMTFTWNGEVDRILLSSVKSVRSPSRQFLTGSNDGLTPVSFVSTDSMPPSRLARLWDAIILTDDELRVIRALQVIEPGVERIAFLSGAASSPRGLGSIVVKLQGVAQPVPLGSMGDGIRRLLAIVMALISAKGGYFLIDEIDTGLHHSVMDEMWKIIVTVAHELDIQVLATTHSLDCVRSLALVAREMNGKRKDVSLHRVERDSDVSVAYSAEEMEIAAARSLELRG